MLFNDISGHFVEINWQYAPSQWMLFISAKIVIFPYCKCTPIDSFSSYFCFERNSRKSYFILNKIKYNGHKRLNCTDLKVVAIQNGLQVIRYLSVLLSMVSRY